MNYTKNTVMNTPSKNSVSDILIGEMELDNVCVHVRIVKF